MKKFVAIFGAVLLVLLTTGVQASALNWVDKWTVDYGYLIKDNQQPVTRLEAAEAIYKVYLLAEGDSTKEYLEIQRISQFSDVQPEFTTMLQILEAKGFFTGMDDGKFYPNDFLTREQVAKIVTIMARNWEIAFSRGNVTFIDVGQNCWSTEYINEAYKMGFIDGRNDKRFAPKEQVKRGELYKILSNVFVVRYGQQNSQIFWEAMQKNSYVFSLEEVADVQICIPEVDEWFYYQLPIASLYYIKEGANVFEKDGNLVVTKLSVLKENNYQVAIVSDSSETFTGWEVTIIK